VGAALPSERIADAAAYFPLQEKLMIAMVNAEDVSAFWLFHIHTTTGKLLAVKWGAKGAIGARSKGRCQ
jgi:hypothetical protein